jgi:drug/metabolite transporter (DMT)-like permease
MKAFSKSFAAFTFITRDSHHSRSNGSLRHNSPILNSFHPIEDISRKHSIKFQLFQTSKDDIGLKQNETHFSDLGGKNNLLALSEEDEQEKSSSSATQAVLLLNLVAIIWGTQHSVVKMVVDDCDAASFSFARFALATAIVSPFTPGISSFLQQTVDGEISLEEDDEQNALAWKWGIEMGLWMFLGYAFQAIGLGYTTAQRSGFLLYLNVKFVPFFARILFGRNISISTWASAFTAFAGTALLAYDGTSLALNTGDLWSVAAAAASAMFILRLESATNAVKDSAALNATSLWMVTATASIWCLGNSIRNILEKESDLNANDSFGVLSLAFQSTISDVIGTVSSHPVELIYLGGVTTAIANYIQTKAQKEIPAERASIIYALDPVYGAFFANLLLGEELSQLGFVGAGLITAAAATNAFLDFKPEEENTESSKKDAIRKS